MFEKLMSAFLLSVILPWLIWGAGIWLDKHALAEWGGRVAFGVLISWIGIGSVVFFIMLIRLTPKEVP
jgi:hypothetical protein